MQETENTLKFVYVIDAHGFIITSRVVDTSVRDFESNEIPHTILPPVYKPKWNGVKWIEGATQEEIDEIIKVDPSPPTDTEQTIELLKKQNQALSKMNTELSNTNADLKQSITLHDGIISELVLKMFDQDTEVM